MKQNKLSRETAYEKYVDGQITREDFLSMRDKLAGELAKLNEEKASIESDLAAYEAAEDSELILLGQEAESFLKAKEVTNQMLLHFISVTTRCGTRASAMVSPATPSASWIKSWMRQSGQNSLPFRQLPEVRFWVHSMKNSLHWRRARWHRQKAFMRRRRKS